MNMVECFECISDSCKQNIEALRKFGICIKESRKFTNNWRKMHGLLMTRRK